MFTEFGLAGATHRDPATIVDNLMKWKSSIGIRLIWLLNIFWTIISALIVLAPYLASIGSPIAGYIYLILKPTCHQMAHRSFFLRGHQFAVCARCTGIWFSMMAFGYIATILLYARKLRQLRLKWFFVAITPLAVDGIIQFIGFHESNNITRLITGSAAGIAVVWFLYPMLWEIKG